MNIKQLVAQGSIAGLLAVSAIGAAPTVSADPDWNNWGHDEWVDDGSHQANFNWNDWQWRSWSDNDWNQWWHANRWRNDDRPPWGWGAPPAVYWRGHIPHDIDYWGFHVHPIWDPDFHAFGFWLFGIFIPIFIIW